MFHFLECLLLQSPVQILLCLLKGVEPKEMEILPPSFKKNGEEIPLLDVELIFTLLYYFTGDLVGLGCPATYDTVLHMSTSL